MLENLKKMFSTPVTVEKKGRGETIKFHTYRISKSGKISDCYGNSVDPIIKEDGVAYIPLRLSENSDSAVEIEVGRIVYCYLVEDIGLLSSTPKITYIDGDGSNFRLKNLRVDKEEIIEIPEEIEVPELAVDTMEEKKKFFNVEEMIDEPEILDDIDDENMVKELREQVSAMDELIGESQTKTSEELVKEINNKASGLISSDFAKEINYKFDMLESTINQLKGMREMDSINYQNKLKEKDTLIEELKLLISKKEQEMLNIVAQNTRLLEEKAVIERDYVVLTKTSFYNMYESMKKVLEMVDRIKK